MNNKKIHFIGIGGIGVSALAKYYLAQGFLVSGSDENESEIVKELKEMGVEIITQPQSSPLKGDEENPPQSSFIKEGVDLVIYSAAVREDNAELVEARKLGIKCQKYAEALGELTKQKYTIAISGMHGKSTTTAMLGLVLEAAGLDPTVIVGTKVREWGNSNCRVGKSQYLVIEADEYDRSFLNYWPQLLVLLNIEEEHLDTYRDLDDIRQTFERYAGQVAEDGWIVGNEDDENVLKTCQRSKAKCQKFNSKVKNDNLKLKIPGKHNISNANAVLAVVEILGINKKTAVETLNNFNGTWRRMEYKGEINGAKAYADYGHHPTEIKATLEGARELLNGGQQSVASNRRLWCVFQPHQYQRTYKLFEKFTVAFESADNLVLLPIYSVQGREDEKIKEKVSSEKLAQEIKNQNHNSKLKTKEQEIIYIDDFERAAEYLKKNLKPGDVCLVMGAGDIYEMHKKLA